MSEPITQEVKADAAQRTWRTLVQGVLATVLVAVIPVVISAIQGGVEAVNWETVRNSAVTAGLMAGLAAVMAILRPVAPTT